MMLPESLATYRRPSSPIAMPSPFRVTVASAAFGPSMSANRCIEDSVKNSQVPVYGSYVEPATEMFAGQLRDSRSLGEIGPQSLVPCSLPGGQIPLFAWPGWRIIVPSRQSSTGGCDEPDL